MRSSQPCVSIVLPAFNRSRILPEAIESVLAQSLTDWRLILVDDHSSDGTADVMEGYMRRDNRIHWLSNRHSNGPAGARNCGLASSTGRYVAFLDSDDVWKEHHLMTCVAALDANSELQWIYGDSEVKGLDGAFVASIFDLHWPHRYDQVERICGSAYCLKTCGLMEAAVRQGICVALQSSVVRRDVFESLRFHEGLFAGEDWLLTLEAIGRGVRFGFVDQVHFTYRPQPDGMSAPATSTTPIDRLAACLDLARVCRILPSRTSLSRTARNALRSKLASLYAEQIAKGIYWRIGDFGSAQTYLTKSLALLPGNLRLWHALAKNAGYRLFRERPKTFNG